MKRWLFLPDSVLTDLATLAGLKAEVIHELRSLLDATQPEDKYALYVGISERLGVADQGAASLYSFWEYVQREKREYRKSGSDVVDEFLAFLSANPPSGEASRAIDHSGIADSIRKKRSAIAALFGEYPNRDAAAKRRTWSLGPLPHVSSVKTYCDLRPIYNKAGSEIVEYLPVVTMRITTHDALGKHHESFIQLPEGGIAMFEEEFERLHRKLDALKVTSPTPPSAEKKNKRRKG